MCLPARVRRSALPALLSVALCMLLPACGILDKGAPETARLVVDGPDGHPLSLVTSTDFDAVTSADGDSREVTVFAADTAQVSIPFEQRYDLGPRSRIFLVVRSDSAASSSVRVQVFIDDEVRFDRSTRFVDVDRLEFVFASAGGNR